MRRFICGAVAAFAALTISMTASANVLNGIGNAAEDVAEGARDAVVGVAEGGESLVEGIVGHNDDENVNVNEHARGNIVDTQGETINEVHGETNENTPIVPISGDVNPATGSVELVTFGALALTAAAIAATTRKKR